MSAMEEYRRLLDKAGKPYKVGYSLAADGLHRINTDNVTFVDGVEVVEEDKELIVFGLTPEQALAATAVDACRIPERREGDVATCG